MDIKAKYSFSVLTMSATSSGKVEELSGKKKTTSFVPKFTYSLSAFTDEKNIRELNWASNTHSIGVGVQYIAGLGKLKMFDIFSYYACHFRIKDVIFSFGLQIFASQFFKLQQFEFLNSTSNTNTTIGKLLQILLHGAFISVNFHGLNVTLQTSHEIKWISNSVEMFTRIGGYQYCFSIE